MTITPGAHERAHIQAEVYRAADGIRWRIRSSKRGRRILSESSEAYVDKRDAFRSLLLTTGGRYTELYRTTDRRTRTAYTQGVIVRGVSPRKTEEIFVEYVSRVAA